MSQIVTATNAFTLAATERKAKIPVNEKLNYLANLSGLTWFEQEFIARLRAYPHPEHITERELTVLSHIWKRHGRARA